MKLRYLLPFVTALLAGPTQARDLTFWAPSTVTPRSPLSASATVYKDLIAEFEKSNPGVKVNYEIMPDGPDALKQILTAASAGRLPDVAVLDGFWVPRIVQTGKLQALNDLWTEANRARFNPKSVIDAVSTDGKIYAVWFFNAYRGIFYRTSVLKQLGFAKAPETWDEFAAFAEKAKAAGYKSAVLFPGKTETATFQPILSMLWGYGGELLDKTGKPVFAEGKNRAALEKVYAHYKTMVDKGYMARDFVTMGDNDVKPYFYARDAAAIVATSSTVTQMTTDAPDLAGDLSVGNYPLPDGAKAKSLVLGFTWGVFANDPEQKKLAWRFVDFLTGKDAILRSHAVTGRLPVMDDVWADKFYTDNPLMMQFKQNLEGAEPRPAFPIYPVADNAISSQLSEVIAGNMTPAQAVDAAAEIVMREYKRMK